MTQAEKMISAIVFQADLAAPKVERSDGKRVKANGVWITGMHGVSLKDVRNRSVDPCIIWILSCKCAACLEQYYP